MKQRLSVRRFSAFGTFRARANRPGHTRNRFSSILLGIAALLLALVGLTELLNTSAKPAAAQPGASCGPAFSTVDVSGAGTGLLAGTGGTAINANGDIVGTYVTAPSANVPNLAHGFVRLAATGTVTSFDAPGAGTGKNQGTFGVSINASGVITGVSSDASVAEHGFVRAADGTITVFDVPAAPTNVTHRGTSPISINDNGVITGMYETADTVRHGFLRAANGTITTFDVPAAGSGLTMGTVPLRINAGGDVAGFYIDANHISHGFIRTAATGAFIAPIDAPGASATAGQGLKFGGTIAVAIDTAGDIAGIYADTSSVYHGYVRTAGGTITTFNVTGAGTAGLFPGTLPTSMNSGGDIAGFYADANGVNHAFVRAFSSGTITAPLDAPSASQSGMFNGTIPLGINASGDLAGTYIDASMVFHGFIYTAAAAAAKPTFSPAPGTYTSAQNVTLSDTTTGATLYYTTDGSTPNPGVGSTLQYTGPIAVSSSETINAIAVASGCSNSAVASGAYTINASLPPAATPTFSPAAGTYTSVQSVSISDTTSGATIYYTTNGTTPSTSSTVYSGPISVNSTETIEAIAAAAGFSNSAVATAVYTLNLPTPDFQVTVNPTSLTIVAGQSGTATFTVTPENGFNSAVSFGCTGLPSEATCTFSPTSVTPNGKAATTTLTVTTTAASAALLPRLPSSSRPAYAMLLPLLALLAFAYRRGSASRGLSLLSLLFLLIAVSGLASCNNATKSVGNPGTPVGTDTVAVSATTGAGGVNHGANLTITITH